MMGHRQFIRLTPPNSEAEMRAGWERHPAFMSSAWRWRYCSTDTCRECGAGPGECCKAVPNGVDYEPYGDPLPYFHLQKREH